MLNLISDPNTWSSEPIQEEDKLRLEKEVLGLLFIKSSSVHL